MKIIRDKSTYRVLYIFEDSSTLYINDTGAHGVVEALDIKTDGYEVIESVPAPEFWAPGALSYNTSWEIYDQDLFDTYVNNIITTEVDRKKAEIDALRKRKFYSSVSVDFPDGQGDIQFRDEVDRSNLANIATAAVNYLLYDPSVDMIYRTEDNMTHTVTASGMAAIAMEVLAQKQSIVSAAWGHKDTIMSMVTASGVPLLTTLSGVRNYNTSTGWPV